MVSYLHLNKCIWMTELKLLYLRGISAILPWPELPDCFTHKCLSTRTEIAVARAKQKHHNSPSRRVAWGHRVSSLPPLWCSFSQVAPDWPKPWAAPATPALARTLHFLPGPEVWPRNSPLYPLVLSDPAALLRNEKCLNHNFPFCARTCCPPCQDFNLRWLSYYGSIMVFSQ